MKFSKVKILAIGYDRHDGAALQKSLNVRCFRDRIDARFADGFIHNAAHPVEATVIDGVENPRLRLGRAPTRRAWGAGLGAR